MTTIMALMFNHGIIMFGDRQSTTMDERAEPTTKLSRLGDNVILGCAGQSNYISDLRERLADAIEGREVKNYKSLLRRVINSHTADLISDAKQQGTYSATYRIPPTHGIMSAYDERRETFHIFEFGTPYIPEDVSDNGYSVIGSGAAPASTLFRVAEFFMERVNFEQEDEPLLWRHLGSGTARSFCAWVMTNVAGQDIYTGVGVDVMQLLKTGVAVDDQHYNMDSFDSTQFNDLVRQFAEDVGAKSFTKLKRSFGLA